MPPNHPLSYGTSGAKKCKAITVEIQMDVLKHYEGDERTAHTICDLEVGQSILRTICDGAEKIKESAKSGTLISASKTSYSRSMIMERMEQMLSTWIKHHTVSVSMFVIQV
ncbi:CENPB DNA-binding domain containing protein 1-like 30 [Homarus americanus]|uniref:CENPB DNA-binding domain containing protein 1-like 30 n=1 Tax=Homarus americanus TaxID=6706 RepID=A0A8J5JTH4_HOMAM|nr:CENPB DNA-binding domain containing protein 1-like 30 [Homarus americanus]